ILKLQEQLHVYIYIISVIIYLCNRRTGYMASFGSKSAIPYRGVITVEWNTKVIVINFIVRQVFFKQKLFNKPTAVRQMPFGWTYKIYGFRDIVFSVQHI